MRVLALLLLVGCGNLNVVARGPSGTTSETDDTPAVETDDATAEETDEGSDTPEDETDVPRETEESGEPAPPNLCGNGVIDAGELCDGANVGNGTCAYFDLFGGPLLCAADCLNADLTSCSEQGICRNSCSYPRDGDCDDGGPNAQYSLCDYGSDCADCGPRDPGYAGCEHSCRWDGDGTCDDGGAGSTTSICALGTDCLDCGRR